LRARLIRRRFATIQQWQARGCSGLGG
jgi:hypothetical protein